MRLLLDESLPRLLAEQLTGHRVTTVQSIGWAGVGNGELLRLAAEAGFEALVTPDRGFEFEQNPETLPVVVVILRARRRILHFNATFNPSADWVIQQLRETSCRRTPPPVRVARGAA